MRYLSGFAGIVAFLAACAAASAQDAPLPKPAIPKDPAPATPPPAAASPVQILKKNLEKKGFKAPQMAGNLCNDPPKPRKGPPPFGPGETIYYLVTVKDIPVGKVVVKSDSLKDKDGRKLLHTTARGKTNSFFSKINKVRAFVENEIDYRTGQTVSFHEDVTEKDIPRESFYTFDREKGKVRIKSKYDGRALDDSVAASRQVHDFLSALYYVRNLPLLKGQGLCFEVSYFRHIWKLTGTVIGKERIQTPAGFFNTIVIDGTALRMDDRSRTRHVTVWLTDDQWRIPVKASSNLQMGETAIYASFIKKMGKSEGEGIAEEPDKEEGAE